MFILECLESHQSILSPPPVLPPVLFPHSGVSGKGPGHIGRVGRGSLDDTDPPAETVVSTPLGSASLTQASWILFHHPHSVAPFLLWSPGLALN